LEPWGGIVATLLVVVVVVVLAVVAVAVVVAAVAFFFLGHVCSNVQSQTTSTLKASSLPALKNGNTCGVM
jgi:hypothetical protein